MKEILYQVNCSEATFRLNLSESKEPEEDKNAFIEILKVQLEKDGKANDFDDILEHYADEIEYICINNIFDLTVLELKGDMPFNYQSSLTDAADEFNKKKGVVYLYEVTE